MLARVEEDQEGVPQPGCVLVVGAEASQDLAPGLHRVPAAIEQRVARAKIAALGIRHDRLDEAQREYLLTY